MEVAINFVEFEENDEHSLKISDEALMKIKNLPPDYGIKTMAFVGPGRTGKSSLLNWIVGKNVFKIGSTTERVTKGIWLYIDKNEDTQLANIYLDVEVFGDPSKSNADEYDKRLLNIVVQICDVVLYNIKEVYNSDMRDKIKFVCSLFNRYRKGNDVLEKPILVCVSRDFDLDPPDCPDTEFQNLFRQHRELLDTFRETKAFLLLKPIDSNAVVDLENTPATELCEAFVKGRDELKTYLSENTMPLRAAQNKTITGIVLEENIRRTVKHVNNDNFRMLSKSLPEILKEKNDGIMKSALNSYKTEMRKKWPQPSQPETLKELHEKEKNFALQHIHETCFTISGSVEIDKQTFKDEIENMLEEMQKDKCKEVLESAVFELKERLQRDAYFEDGGLEQFLSDYEKAEKAYTECRNLGPKKLEVWEKYIEGLKTVKELIHQRAKVRDIEKTAAVFEKDNKELNEKLEKEMEKNEVMRKEFKKSQRNDQILQRVLETGKFLAECGKDASQIYCNVKAVNSQVREQTRAPSANSLTNPSLGSSVALGDASSSVAMHSGANSLTNPSLGSSAALGDASSSVAITSGANSLTNPSLGSSVALGDASSSVAMTSGGTSSRTSPEAIALSTMSSIAQGARGYLSPANLIAGGLYLTGKVLLDIGKM